MKIYAAINKVKAALAVAGIPKDQRNTLQNYNFRGIDDFLERLAPLLAENSIDIFPQASEYSVTEAESKSGGVLFKTVAKVTYKFVHTEDASSETVTVFGESMDSGDKGMNKAFSSAFKVMAIQTFVIPAGDGSDTEHTSHEVASTNRTQPRGGGEVPDCPSCGTNAQAMRSQYSAGYYCKGCRVKYDPNNSFAGTAT